jgi:hypothetical protein
MLMTLARRHPRLALPLVALSALALVVGIALALR